MKIMTFAMIGVLATLSLTHAAEAKSEGHRSKLTAAQLERAKARMERDGTASVATAPATPAKRACSNISCLGFATMLGVGY